MQTISPASTLDPLTEAGRPPKPVAPIQRPPRAPLSDLRVVRTLGTGAHGRVRLVRDTNTGLYYALKTVRKTDANDGALAYLEREARALVRLAHPLIAGIVQTHEGADEVGLQLELQRGGDLAHLIDLMFTVDGPSEKTARFYLAGIALAIAHVHALGYIHRDIKPENVLLATDGSVKLADFAFARPLAATERALTLVGTMGYAAPELMAARGATRASDAWSLGVLAYELMHGHQPFAGDDDQAVVAAVLTGARTPIDRGIVGDEFADLLRRLLCVDEEARLTVASALLHGFFEECEVDGVRARTVVPPWTPKFRRADETRHAAQAEVAAEAETLHDLPANAEREARYAFFFAGL